jgi:large subunit ribosomal protein L31e
MPKDIKKGKKEKQEMEPITRDCTVNLHKALYKIQFKRRAPRAIRHIKQMARNTMHTEDVRIDAKLNQYIWGEGIKNVPRKVRVRINRKKNEEEDAKTKFYSLVQHLDVDDFHGLKSEKVIEKK